MAQFFDYFKETRGKFIRRIKIYAFSSVCSHIRFQYNRFPTERKWFSLFFHKKNIDIFSENLYYRIRFLLFENA